MPALRVEDDTLVLPAVRIPDPVGGARHELVVHLDQLVAVEVLEVLLGAALEERAAQDWVHLLGEDAELATLHHNAVGFIHLLHDGGNAFSLGLRTKGSVVDTAAVLGGVLPDVEVVLRVGADNLAARFLHNLVEELDCDGTTALARGGMQRIPATTDNPGVILVLRILRRPLDELLTAFTIRGMVARHHQVAPRVMILEVFGVELLQGSGKHLWCELAEARSVTVRPGWTTAETQERVRHLGHVVQSGS
ncbi:MAG: hypothetical protein B7Z23_12410 [Pseudomonadales bacterium 32-61-5]|nr:MAG: hypothetical protein B7Z23_12410 [Pseudomonadales bacterium 32-61-5]